ncbi:MAG: hypothetical protein ACTSRH_15365 [Promethearchaeota archaeon]
MTLNSSLLRPLVNNWIVWSTHLCRIAAGKTSFKQDLSLGEKSMVVSLMPRSSQLFIASSKNITSFSLSPETSDPAIGLPFSESFAIKSPSFGSPISESFF